MKIIVFGATGKTGRQVVRQALEARHEVTAFVRDPAQLDLRHPHLHVTAGQVTTDPAAVASAVQGHDAVISALGSQTHRSPVIMSQAMPSLIRAMTDTGVDRLIVLSAFGVGDTYREAPALLKIGYRAVLGRVYADKAAGEQQLRTSALDWTLVYPILLTDGPHTSVYRSAEHLKPRSPWRISRADVADFMLSQVQQSTYSRATAVVTSGE